MLVVVIVVGLIYALPNLYGEDPAVQITGARGVAASEQTLIQVQKTLQEEKITAKSVALEEGAILARFDTTDTQLRAREALLNVLGDKYVVALNLAPATPRWLAALYAEPMKLGLDLRGGVHFLMEVDMDTALGKLQEQNIDSLRSELRDKGIPYATVRKEDNYGLSIAFRDSAARDQAISYLSPRHRDLVISTQGSTGLKAVMTDDRLKEAREYAVQQNINILRNRVNQLGVAEPLVQRQGADRIVVELPGIQDTARAKEILGATATLEFRLVNTNVDSAAAAAGRVPGDSEVKYPAKASRLCCTSASSSPVTTSPTRRRAWMSTTRRRLTSPWIALAATSCLTSPRTTSVNRWRPCLWSTKTAGRKMPTGARFWRKRKR